MDIVPLVTAFTLILFSELGDKTQLAVMALSSKASA
ncbi:MAG: TMEM165/GDT1 family protein, partial [Candidatus Brockarchaeota archaeon]|nr:TMEM165/GDT1 family protein [Candidatus Brockarchaeota archaeon]